MVVEQSHPFGALLRSLRVRIGLSQNQLARRAGVDPAYVNRLERAQATSTSLPSRKVVLALADSVEAGPVDVERLLVAAGLCPEAIVRLGGWDKSPGDIAAVLADTRLAPAIRARPRRAAWAAGDRGLAVASWRRPRDLSPSRPDRRRLAPRLHIVNRAVRWWGSPVGRHLVGHAPHLETTRSEVRYVQCGAS